MAEKRVYLAPNTWTDLSGHYTTVGRAFTIRSEGSPVELGLKASAPTAVGQTVPAFASAHVLIGQGALKPWARIVAGGYISLDRAAAPIVLVEPTTATA